MPRIATASRSGIPTARGRSIEYKDRAEANGRKYDVVTIVPEGGRPFEFWIDVDSKLIERLVEREADVDAHRGLFRPPRGAGRAHSVPRAHVARRSQVRRSGDGAEARVQRALSPTSRSGRRSRRRRSRFPAGRASVEVPFEALSGHLFVQVMLDGRGPFRMLFDAGGANVLTAQTAAALAGHGRALPKTLNVASTDDQRRRARRPALRRRRHRSFPAPGRRPRRHRRGARARMVRAHAGSHRLRALAHHALRPGAVQGAAAAPRWRWRSAAGCRRSRGTHRRHRGHVRDRHGKPRLADADAGVRRRRTISRRSSRRRTSRSRAPVVGGPVRASLARGEVAEARRRSTCPIPSSRCRRSKANRRRREVAGNVGFALMRQFAVTYDLPNDALYFERYLNFGAPGHRRPRRAVARAQRRRLQGGRRGERRPGRGRGAQGRRRDRRGERLSVRAAPAAGGARSVALAAGRAGQAQDGATATK